ncbi:DUF1553 domain-containing protein [Blastopirellula marina]|nr:DUF1553 domain-containing protein [Blastopirellula marina]
MPPLHEGEPLNKDEVTLLRRWIDSGAAAPENEQPERDPLDHWSFRPIERPNVPHVNNQSWVRNPIDSWIAQGHERQGLFPQQEASRIVLLRRLYLDLIGLPPTAEEIAAAEADQSSDWYEKVVDRLLSDPRHGERWGRHWMDVWRYSDWWGLNAQLRNSQRHMWHWRDWIVESLNEDRPYDEMVRMMLAADELAPNNPQELRATGFLARNYFIFNRDQWMDEVVTHVSKGFLGLTMTCSKCHDHKFDPLPQEDYYQMRAIFEPYHVRTDMVQGETNLTQDGIPRAFDGVLDAPTYLYVRGNEAQPDKSHTISPGVPGMFDFAELDVQQVSLPEKAWQPGQREWVLNNYLSTAQQRLEIAKARRDEIADRLQSSNSSIASAGPASNYSPLVESFDTLDLSLWEVSGDGWRHTPGKLQQTLDGKKRYELTFTGPTPQDFDASLRFSLEGGSTYRSVGLDFDVANNKSKVVGNEPGTFSYVYLSGWQRDSKVQGAFSQQGNSQYPAEARKPFSPELGREYTLNVKVRGTLINVFVNGEHLVAWHTPLPRKPGTIRLMTFDALATIDEFKLTSLDPAYPMISPQGQSPQGMEDELQLAEADLRVAQAEFDSVSLRVLATRAQNSADASHVRTDARKAIKAERRLAVEKATRDVLKAEQHFANSSEKTRGASQKELDEAKNKLDAARKRLKSEIAAEDIFTPFVGARWSATRFQNTGKDDPQISFPSKSTGRRSALARWITDRRNPLTARVAVNHLWNRHFATPLAPAPFDLGRNSPEPVHPEIIDWLATELMENGWSMKHVHRQIVTSATYRMSSSVKQREANELIDPDNRYWWRRNPIRLESQAVRDSILYLAGTLDETQGGPSVPTDQQAQSKRRSLYFFHSNNERNLFLLTFDEAEVTECYLREQSVVPQQALAMTNSDLVLGSAESISGRISEVNHGDEDFIRAAFKTILGIHPDEEELSASQAALEAWAQLENGSTADARSNLVWILLNHNDFVTVR